MDMSRRRGSPGASRPPLPAGDSGRRRRSSPSASARTSRRASGRPSRSAGRARRRCLQPGRASTIGPIGRHRARRRRRGRRSAPRPRRRRWSRPLPRRRSRARRSEHLDACPPPIGRPTRRSGARLCAFPARPSWMPTLQDPLRRDGSPTARGTASTRMATSMKVFQHETHSAPPAASPSPTSPRTCRRPSARAVSPTASRASTPRTRRAACG